MQIITTSYKEIEKLRFHYLQNLPLFQELFLELMIKNANYYFINSDNTDIAYAIVSKDGILLEFYFISSHNNEALAVFETTCNRLNVKEIYCKSFDKTLMWLCETKHLQVNTLGLLFRDFKKRDIQLDTSISYHYANEADISKLMSQDESINELFETEEQLRQFITIEKVVLFEKQAEFIGCGMIIRTHKNWNYCDLGVWVHPNHRNLGIGTQIILRLKHLAESAGFIPSCGCAIDNVASHNTIKRSGFKSNYKMLSYTLE